MWDHSKIQKGHIRALNEINAEYRQINRPIRLKASVHRNKNISLLGKHIILSGHEPVQEGTLIQFKFDLECQSQKRIYNSALPICKRFIGIGQVLRILEMDHARYKMLIRLLDLCPAR
jgi:hypothetical protein